jgi:protein SCO1
LERAGAELPRDGRQAQHHLIDMRALLPLALAALVASACGGSSAGSGTQRAATAPPYAAPALATPSKQAPEIALRDSTGKPFTLSGYRGRAILLTFIYDHCPDVCPLIVGNLHSALAKLGPQNTRKVQIVAVSVDPRGDTRATVKRFLAAHGMTRRMEYLIGSRRQLEPVWRSYGVAVKGTPDSREVSHSAYVLGIGGSGRIITLYPSNFQPAWIAHDVPLLAEH